MRKAEKSNCNNVFLAHVEDHLVFADVILCWGHNVCGIIAERFAESTDEIFSQIPYAAANDPAIQIIIIINSIFGPFGSKKLLLNSLVNKP